MVISFDEDTTMLNLADSRVVCLIAGRYLTLCRACAVCRLLLQCPAGPDVCRLDVLEKPHADMVSASANALQVFPLSLNGSASAPCRHLHQLACAHPTVLETFEYFDTLDQMLWSPELALLQQPRRPPRSCLPLPFEWDQTPRTCQPQSASRTGLE